MHRFLNSSKKKKSETKKILTSTKMKKVNTKEKRQSRPL